MPRRAVCVGCGVWGVNSKGFLFFYLLLFFLSSITSFHFTFNGLLLFPTSRFSLFFFYGQLPVNAVQDRKKERESKVIVRWLSLGGLVDVMRTRVF